MTIQVDFWQVVLLALSIFGSFAGVAKLLMAQVIKGVDDKFATVAECIEKLSAQSDKYGDDVLRLEREMAALRLEMMRDFTRREDHNQAIASIRVGLDNMSLRIEKALASGGRVYE